MPPAHCQNKKKSGHKMEAWLSHYNQIYLDKQTKLNQKLQLSYLIIWHHRLKKQKGTMRGGEDAGHSHSQHRSRLRTSPSHWLLWQAADVQSLPTSGQLRYEGRWGGETHLTDSPLGMQILQGYRHTVPLPPVLFCTLHFLIAEDMQKNAQQRSNNPKTGTNGPLMQPCLSAGSW